MPEQEKIGAVRRYLEDQFPGHTVHDFDDRSRTGHSFRIDHDGVSHLVMVSDEFLKDFPTEAIPKLLHRFGLADTLRRVGRREVIVAPSGLKVKQ